MQQKKPPQKEKRVCIRCGTAFAVTLYYNGADHCIGEEPHKWVPESEYLASRTERLAERSEEPPPSS
jgi:hypothetical protein